MEKYIAGTHMSQEDYLNLAADCNYSEQPSEYEFKSFINRNFGFEFSRIEIKQSVDTFYSENHRLRKAATYERKPLYSASDWNYIRFDVMGNQWEIINGQLYFYED